MGSRCSSQSFNASPPDGERLVRRLLLLALLCSPAALAAQSRTRTVAPGMSRAQVVAALGAPTTARSASDYEYLFYRNECGRRCGMNDLVVLRKDSVVDAIFRSKDRVYTGTSSSPAPVPASVAASRKPSSAGAPTRMKPAPANDVRPSIPLDQPATRPAPSPTPAKKIP
jgi:hypothetical protein